MTLGSLRRTNQLLAKLSDTEFELFESLAREVLVPTGTVLFEEGGQADTFFVVDEGKVGLEMTSPGKKPMVVQTLGPGDLVGLSWLFPPHRWNWRARAQTDTRLVAFDAAEVRRHCQENDHLALAVMEVVAAEVAKRLHNTRIQLLDLYRRP